MTTIKDVARLAGVSISTVSRTISGKIPVDEKTRETVLRCIQELDYQPNAIAKGLKEGKTNTIAFLIPNIENQIYPSLAIAVETEARKRGYFVVFCNTQDQLSREQDYVDKLKNRFVDGFIFSTAMVDKQSQPIMELRSQGYPSVCLMRSMEDDTDTFVSDNEQGAYLGTKFLIECGFTKIATIVGRSQLALYNQRLAGYKRALSEHGIPVEPDLIWTGVEGESEKAYHIVMNTLKQGRIPQAIFAQSDPLAFDAIRAINALKLKVPDDISVLGYDNVPFAECYTPTLTTVEQPLYEMGRVATSRLIDIIEGKVPSQGPVQYFPPRIIIRESVKLPLQMNRFTIQFVLSN